MKISLLAICLFISFISNAHTYIPFPTSNAQWNGHYLQFTTDIPGVDAWSERDEFSYFTGNDTLITGVHYTQLFMNNIHYSFWIHPGSGSYHNSYSSSGYAGCFRNDSLNHRVMYLPFDSTTEHIMYDFNVQIGDTIENWWFNFAECNSDPAVVQSIDSLLYGGIYRKSITLTTGNGGWINNSNYIVIIEGIGSSSGLLNPLSFNLLNCDGVLDCFVQNSTTIFPDAVTQCGLINSVSVNSFAKTYVNVYPNPTSDLIKLSSEKPISKLLICNIYGEKIFQSPYSQVLNLSSFPKGIYFLTAEYYDGMHQTSRIVLQ